VVALFAAGILPCIGFSPTLSQSSVAGAKAPAFCRTPKGHLHICTDSAYDRKSSAAIRMAISQRSESTKNPPPWPTLDESAPPVHVRITAGALVEPDVGALGSLVAPVGKKTVTDYTVQVNDKACKPLLTGYFPLRAVAGERLDKSDLAGAQFALTGDLRLNCPSYMHLLPPVAGESVQRLWVTSFGMARSGSVVGLDLTGKLPARRLKTQLVWPNAVEHVPADFLSDLFGDGFDVTASILIADGFLVPGKTDGGVYLVQNPGSSKELSSRLTRRDDTRWFYHRAIPFEMQGHKGVLTARALKPLSPFQPARGELVWLEAPNATNPVAPWNVPWREVVLASGPDVMFEVVDLDVTDDTVEVFAAEFFAQCLTMHSLKWDEGKGVPVVVQREVIDDSLGQAYSVALGDLDGPMSHLLVTTHEYLPVPKKSGLGSLSGGTGWSYMSDSMAPRRADDVNGGSLFAYRIPATWRRREDGYVAALDTYQKMLPEMFRRIDCDNSGQISIDELESSLGWLRVKVTPEQLRAAFQDADWDDSGSIEYNEFERILLDLRRMPEGSKKKGLEAIGQTIEGTLRTIESKTFAASPAMLDKIPSILLQMREQMEGTDTTARDKGINLGELDGILRKAYGSEPYAKQPSVARLFNVLDTDEDGLLTPLQVRELCIRIWRDSNSSRNVWGILGGALESVLARGTAGEEEEEMTWTRTTLATGFSVKRAGINPGAPGFVYPFYPHTSMRRGSAPPHLLVAGDCSDAAYVFRPVRSSTKDGSGAHVSNMDGPDIYGPWVETNRQGAIPEGTAEGTAPFFTPDKPNTREQYLYPGQPAQVNLDFRYPVTTGDTGQLRYELLATFGCEGTVGSVAVGNVDTYQSVDDGWVKFFLPVYEKDRVYMLKCGQPPTMGYLADDDW